MSNKVEQLTALLKERIKTYSQKRDFAEVGKVLSTGDGIAIVAGLDDAQLYELLKFPNDVYGLAFNLEEDYIGVALLGESDLIKEGMEVKRTGDVVSVPVGEEVTGRVVDALIRPIDGKGPINSKKMRQVFVTAPGVMTRQAVDQPVETGILSIDSMIPIGKGQRELIIGDRQTGKTAIAIDTILNQKGKNVKCIYVAVGQKNSSVAQIVKKLEDNNAMEYTTVVVAGASELPIMLHIAVNAATSVAEEFMSQGQDVIIVYDDLTKHAVAYRTNSLLLRNPPGREAYPGDIFYTHSSLLERSARLNSKYGGGSITALPIIETQQGDISAYIPTNVISITDGQIFTREALFNAGQRPAVDVGYSVSRVGSAAQYKMMKQVAGTLKLDLAQYNEMQTFAQFGSDLDESTKSILDHGSKVYEILKQEQYNPIEQTEQVIIFLALKEKVTNILPVSEITTYKANILKYFAKEGFNLRSELEKSKALSEDLRVKILEALIKIAQDQTKTIPGYNSKDYRTIPYLNKKAEATKSA
ncbi:F0F1 ATP synthase subunit alpha [Mycoplasmopsis agassizii]|uniref:ATP synthase subunit alpha n=1 Tax=Mycoplasmopsis agassizii TaxID=33922 RepID=A0ABX4H573_9BACT|nr:F0F1 ATP synthase subunit alpha [Mycoplasmopsis agassizii]PAF55045.1 F0F1 ATP synthase subunit alpha [Mycoplasmopsis agassizii]SMC17424.1 F-type H+-transporting ATPase subunit alpha [Mycoplasmopsis agassizii]